MSKAPFAESSRKTTPDEQKNSSDRRQPSCQHVVLLVGVGLDEPAVEVVHEVRRAPVEVRQDRGGVGGDEAADHQADEADGQELQHRGIRDVVAEQPRVERRERLLDVGQLRIHEDRAERDEDPRPRAQHVVRDVEEEHRGERIPLGLGRQHALRDVAAAARLGARVPDGPPLHGNRHDEHRDGDVPVVGEIGQDAEVVHAVGPADHRQLGDERVEAADLRRLQREVRGRGHRRHLDEELDHVDDEHAPEARVRRERDVEHADEGQRLPAREAEEHAGDLAGRQVHGGHDQAVEQQAEVDCAEAAHQARRRCPSSGSRRTRDPSSRRTGATTARRRRPSRRPSARTPTTPSSRRRRSCGRCR